MFYTWYKQYGNNILLRYKKGSVTISSEIKNYRPSLYGTCTKEESNTDFISFYGNPLNEMKFENIKEAKNFLSQYKDIDGIRIEGNTRFDNQYIIEKCNATTPEYKAKDISGLILDIEVDVKEGDSFPEPSKSPAPINIITCYNTKDEKFYTFSLKPYDEAVWNISNAPEYLQELDIEFIQFETEVELLESFIKWWCSEYPDFSSGWNSGSFDMPYLVNRIEKLFGTKTLKCLSPFGIVNQKQYYKEGKEIYEVDILGIPHLDYLDVYKKIILSPRENYKLDTIAEVETGFKKIEHEESFEKFYNERYQDFCSYNIQDVNLIRLIEKKLGLFLVIYAISYFALANYDDALGTVKIWEELVAKYLYSIKKVPLSKQEKGINRSFVGAFVHPVIVGKHGWSFCEDLNSLYPHNEMQYNIGLETHIPYKDLPSELQKIADSNISVDDLIEGTIDLSILKKYDIIMAPNKQFYRKDIQSVFSSIKENLYADRKAYKKKMKLSDQELIYIKQEMEKRGLSH